MHLLGLGWASPTKIIEFHVFFTKPGWFNRNIIVVTLSSGLSSHDGPRYSIPPSVHLLFSDGKERVHTHLARIFGTLSGQSNPRTYGLRFEISYQHLPANNWVWNYVPFVSLCEINIDELRSSRQVLNPLFEVGGANTANTPACQAFSPPALFFRRHIIEEASQQITQNQRSNARCAEAAAVLDRHLLHHKIGDKARFWNWHSAVRYSIIFIPFDFQKNELVVFKCRDMDR